ncbi:MAG TPA: DinB family protein [Ruminiclostridium sp.]|nr:DinB family protein [Ruminiclostridium sp.]
MNSTTDFLEIINRFKERLAQTPEEKTDISVSEDSWSLKEIIGHLIDSASNNHQRFVRLQSGDLLDFPEYDGEEWIRIQKYNEMSWDCLVTLWYSYNLHIIKVIEHIDIQTLKNVWVRGEEVIELEFLISEYYSHMKWHFQQFYDRQAQII